MTLILGIHGVAFGDDVYSVDAGRGNRAAVSGRTNAGVANSLRSMTRAAASRSATVQPRAVSGRGTSTKANVARSGTSTTTPTTTLMTASGGSHTGATAGSGRVAMRSASASARTPSIASVSVNNNNTVTAIAETVKTVTANLDSLAELSDYCKLQYTQCMDNFCNVLDDNQGRCSCSKNVKNYEKTEEALRAATEALQDVAQNIQYIGLTPREINTLFEQTEAELAMQTVSDNSKIKNDLDRIKNMLVDVKSGSSSA
ncbi:MAG: hypothetical protein J6W79_01025, partial [Alphaproteobacteria bacterium]|nr:hypothetical protein [Alphaproteobacteria bacterium]